MSPDVLIAIPMMSGVGIHIIEPVAKMIIHSLKRNPEMRLDVKTTYRIGLPYAHLRLAQKFLRGSYSHILFLEEDNAPPPATLCALLERKLPVVGALYFARDPAERPMLFKRGMSDGELTVIRQPEQGSLVKVDTTGLGCCLIERAVFEVLGYNCFEQLGMYADDYLFFQKVREAGFSVFVDTSVVCDHLREKIERVNKQSHALAEEKLRCASTWVAEKREKMAT